MKLSRILFTLVLLLGLAGSAIASTPTFIAYGDLNGRNVTLPSGTGVAPLPVTLPLTEAQVASTFRVDYWVYLNTLPDNVEEALVGAFAVYQGFEPDKVMLKGLAAGTPPSTIQPYPTTSTTVQVTSTTVRPSTTTTTLPPTNTSKPFVPDPLFDLSIARYKGGWLDRYCDTGTDRALSCADCRRNPALGCVMRMLPANQYQKAVMQETLYAKWMNEAIWAIEGVTGSQSVVDFCLKKKKDVAAGFGWPYVAKAILTDPRDRAAGSTWTLTPGGEHYSMPQYCMEQIASFWVNKQPTLCAQKLGSNQDMLDVLNLKVVGSACVRAGYSDRTSSFPPAVGAVTSTIKNDGVMNTKLSSAASCSAAQRADADALHALHASATNAKCGLNPAPDQNVQMSHLVYESKGAKAADKMFRWAPNFNGRCDPDWSAEDCCWWSRVTDRLHHHWHRGQVTCDNKLSIEAGGNHGNAHDAMNNKDDHYFLIEFSCGTGPEIHGTCEERTPVGWIIWGRSNFASPEDFADSMITRKANGDL